MKGRYEIKDAHFPDQRGTRYNSLERAKKELSWAIPKSRFYLWDRLEKKRVN